MEIKIIHIRPYEKAIFPGIAFEVEITHTKYKEMIIGVDGWLETDDRKIISTINEDLLEGSSLISELGARGSSFDSWFKEEIYKTTVVAPLDKKALNYIEERRMKDKKGDVKLFLNLTAKVLENRASVSHLHEVNPKNIGLEPVRVPLSSGRVEEAEIIVYAHDPGFSPARTNRWVLSGYGSPIFLAARKYLLRTEKTIPSSDWISDFAPKLELGEYFVVEIPKGKLIKDAWDYVEKAEECFRRWDTKGLYANCREIGSLLDGVIKKKFGKDSFIYRERWGRTYGRFENFASLDLHLEDIKKSQQYIREDIKIRKADAEHILIVTKTLIKFAEELSQES
ncbi:MAG: hypothetical protein QME57_04505 [Patescibacteria group bacterium]|nr:hypothetical protein [Patescibacteria group bacterium]